MASKNKTHVLFFPGLFTQQRPRDSFMTSAEKKVYSESIISVDCSDISYLYELFILREAVKWEILIIEVIFTIVNTVVMNHGFQK